MYKRIHKTALQILTNSDFVSRPTINGEPYFGQWVAIVDIDHSSPHIMAFDDSIIHSIIIADQKLFKSCD